MPEVNITLSWSDHAPSLGNVSDKAYWSLVKRSQIMLPEGSPWILSMGSCIWRILFRKSLLTWALVSESTYMASLSGCHYVAVPLRLPKVRVWRFSSLPPIA